MKKFTVPTREEVSAANQANFDALKKAIGMVPNLYATIALSDNGLSRYLAFQAAKTSLSNKEKEAVNLIVSQVNGCIYCQSAHTVLGKMNGFTEDDILNIRSGQIAYNLGFDDEYYFSRFFKNNADVSPQLFRDTVGFARAEA